MNWLKSCKGKIKYKEPLSKHTSLKVGGKASIWFEPNDVGDLEVCLKNLYKSKKPYFIIGNGSNLLCKDNGFKGVVIRLSSKRFKNMRINKGKSNICVSAGVDLGRFLKYISEQGYGGYEFLVGIPGTIGGAVAMNAGTTIRGKKNEIGQFVQRIKVIDKRGLIIDLDKDKILFGYRFSNLKNYIILEVELKLKKVDSTLARNRTKDFLSYRKERLDYSCPNAGSIFKNPKPNLAAGYLIDRCGLKGLRIGGAMISNRHGNFILNFNQAKAKDVLQLMKRIKEDVKKSFDIRLEEEILIVG